MTRFAVFTTADCDRHSSEMNYIKNARRNRLDIHKISHMMVCKRYGLSMEFFDPTSFISKWISEGKPRYGLHSVEDVKKPKAKVDRASLNNEEELLVQMATEGLKRWSVAPSLRK